MNTRLTVCVVGCFAVFAVAITLAQGLAAQTGNKPLSHEYFIRQAADEALLIQVNAFEAEFESRVIGQNGETLLKSSLKGSRIVPMFQYVAASAKPRQLDVRVSSVAHTDRTEFELQLTRLTVWDDRSNAVANAYRLLSFGMESDAAQSAANWTVKIDSLMTAGRLFRQFGMKEMRLWANYLAAHLVYQQLHDYSMSYGLVREILSELKGSQFRVIELASLQLQSAALIGLNNSGSLQRSDSSPDPINASLLRAARLAGEMGFDFEQARSLETLAAYTAGQADYDLALEQYQQALGIAQAVGDAELSKGIRESILAIHNRQGNTPASSEVLKQIETQLEQEGGGDELALNLLTQGRLLIRTYQLGQAMEVLGQALRYQNNSSIRRQIHYELGRASYQSGRWDDAMNYLKLAGVNPASGESSPGSSLFDHAEALGIMANIHRARGESEQTDRVRAAQGRSQPVNARYLYDRGLDALADAKTSSQQALTLFRQSHAAAVRAGSEGLAQLARLQACALAGKSDALCAGSNAAYEQLRDTGIPHIAAEAMYLRAQILAGQGRYQEVIKVLQTLADDIHFFRHSVPGAMGAWFWERHVAIFEDAIQLMVDSPAASENTDQAASLLALSQFRRIANYPNVTPYDQGTDSLRALLAQAFDSWPALPSARLNQDIQLALEPLRVAFQQQFKFLSIAGLRDYLQTFSSNESMLTFHVGRNTTHVWVGRKGMVYRRQIELPDSLERTLSDIPHELPYLDQSVFIQVMDKLGATFLKPIDDLLTGIIYWVPAGPLLGLPFDALRLDGHYLVERHQVVNLLSVPGSVKRQRRLQSESGLKVFLAGHPQEYSGEYVTRLQSSAEIRTVTDIFVGPGLHIIQGTALLEDEFQDARFLTADLVHMGMPGVIDIEYPDQSIMQLSGDELNPRATFLLPLNIRSQPLDAGLVCLSSLKLTGKPVSTLNSRLGLISDFLDGDAETVVAGLWGSNEVSGQLFLADFYQRLKSTGQVQEALLAAKRNNLRAHPEDGLNTWAAYQMFVY